MNFGESSTVNRLPLNLLDNHFGKNAHPFSDLRIASVLKPYSGKVPKDFKSMGVHVFSAEESDESDGSSERLSVFTLSQDEKYINTHNCMGVLRFRDKESEQSVLLQIKSRFDEGGDKQFFLTYLLNKVFGGCFTDDPVPSDPDSMWDILVAFIFRRQLQHACEVGLFKQYRKFAHNNLRYRGKFNLDEHLKLNMPFLGKIAYTTKDITFDNPVNHLIRHAMAKINKKWPWLLAGDNELVSLRHEFEQNTPSWQQGDAISCIHKKENASPIKHPFFADYYEPLRKLALSILHDEGASLYDSRENEVEGIIFDGAWLWEEYIATILPLGFTHCHWGKEGMKVFESEEYTLYPDFWYKEKRIVFDTKYKRVNNRREDIHQVLAYMFLANSNCGGLIYPPDGKACTPEIKDQDPRMICRTEKDSTEWHDIVFGSGINPDKQAMEKAETSLQKYIDTLIRER